MNEILQSEHANGSDTHPLSSRIRLGGIALLILGAVGVVGSLWFKQHARTQQAKARQAQAEAGPLVRTLVMGSSGTLGDPMVQGEALPFLSTTLYARASGFLKEIRVDKGSQVRKGQVLAVIEGREMDQDLEALRADAENRRRNAQRTDALFRQGLISARDAEQDLADARMAESKLASLGVSKEYQEIRAPFDGVVTQRFADPGALVQNASSSTNAQPVVTVAQVDRLLVTVYLDQGLARRVKTGDPVRVVPDRSPDQKQQARISRLSGALDPRTRTLTAEVDVDNRQGLFLPGSSVQVLIGKPGEGGFTLPLEAIAQRQGKPHALVVDGQSHVRWWPLGLGEDNGQHVRVTQGLTAGERVVLNPPAGLVDGAIVRVAEIPTGNVGK